MAQRDGRMGMEQFLKYGLTQKDYEKLQEDPKMLRAAETNMNGPYDSRFPGTDAQQQCWQYVQDWKRCESHYGGKYMCKYWQTKAYQICPQKWIQMVTEDFALPFLKEDA